MYATSGSHDGASCVRRPVTLGSYVNVAAASAAAACLLLTVGCTRSTSQRKEGSVETPRSAHALIKDQVHNGGAQGFFWLPPMVSQPALEGAFDGTLAPQVDIDEIDSAGNVVSHVGTFTTGGGPHGHVVEIKLSGGHYQLNWKVTDFEVEPDKVYRIKVTVNARAMGVADVQIVANGSQARNVDTGQFIALIDNQTLPIKFFLNQCGGVFCQAPNACLEPVGVCNLADKSCSYIPRANGTACSDGDACTQTDSCQAGACVGSNSVTCTASDQCHDAGVCDPGTGVCSDPAKADGVSCSDGDACTQTDSCQAGACVGASPVVCTASDQCHDVGACDPGTGVCSDPAKVDGVSCSDGNACTQTDSCQAGACVGASPVFCTASDQCHDPGVCNPASGVCTNPAKANGASCADGNACTQTDSCQAGACVGASPVVCTASDQCHEAGECNPGTGVCTNPAKADGASCTDGNACTQTDSCQVGACVGASPVVCTASDQCHDAGVCDPGTGVCSDPPKADGASCTDGNACTQTDSCQAGACVGASPVVCTASDQCHEAGTCEPATGICSNPAKADGASCADGNACTQTDSCQAGACVGASPVVCTASDQCHEAGTCEPATGICSNPAKADGASCADGNACTQTDSCQAGECVGASPVVCTASDQCHEAGTCEPATGICSNPAKADGASCADGNACTQTDSCQAGECVGASPVVCTASDQCHDVGVCNPSTGACSNPPKPDGSTCSDGNACTQTDSCQSGACLGASPIVCTASDECHGAGSCDPATGVCSNPTLADGTGCSDGNACTQADSCQAGACVSGEAVVCQTPPTCQLASVCAPDTGNCSAPGDCNQPPSVTAAALPNPAQLPDEPLLVASAQDDGLPAGSVLTYAWSALNGPAEVSLATPAASSTTARFAAPGTYRFLVTVSDSQLSSSAEVTVVVEAPQHPDIFVSEASLPEGQSGSSDALVIVTLSHPTDHEVAVEYMTEDGSATGGCDYARRGGVLSFAPGEVVATIRIPILGDTLLETNEELLVRLGNPLGGVLAADSARVLITNDDTANQPPTSPSNRSPVNGTTGAALASILSWRASDPDQDPLRYDVHLGTAVSDGSQRWRKICPVTPGGLAPRAFSAWAFDDTTDRLMLFGGTSGSADLSELWILRGAAVACDGAAWTRIVAPGEPSARKRGIAVYDAAADRFIVQGGCTGGCATATAETWAVDGASSGTVAPWQALPSAPVALRDHAAALDAGNHRLIVFGGVPESSTTPVNDVWILSNAAGTGAPAWQSLSTTGTRPAARSGATVQYDAAPNRLILFGGRGAGDAVLNDVWVLERANGLGGASSWTQLTPSGAAPSGRWGHGAGYDPGTRRLIVFGGSGSGYESGSNVVSRETWLLSHADGTGGTPAWTRLAPPLPGASPRLGALFAYSPAQNRALLLGGQDNRTATAAISDAWALEDAGGTLPRVAADVDANTFAPAGLVVNTTYLWRLVARDSHGATSGAPVFRFDTSVPSLSIQDISVAEGHEGTAEATFTVTLSRPFPQEVRASFTTQNGDATAGADYLAASGVVVFAPGITSAPIHVSVLGDRVFEAAETFAVQLSGPAGATLARASATGTILNDEAVPNAAPLVNAGPDRIHQHADCKPGWSGHR